jgi:hypothetical protein
MTLPKAVLCILGDEPAEHTAEAELRSVGFATFAITWKELDAQPNGWIRILPPLDDPTVNAWILVGKPSDFTGAIRSKIAMLTLALTRKKPPLTAFVLTDEGTFDDVPYALNHVQIFGSNKKYAARLMAARMRPADFQNLPFHVRAHLDSLIGAWLEIGPSGTDVWPGFMVGVTLAEIVAFGVGPRGVLPKTSALQFPQLGIKGTLGETPFSACAAKNDLTAEVSCYMRLEGFPGLVFCTDYLDDDPDFAGSKRSPVQLELL